MQIYKSSCSKEIMDLIVIFTSLCISLSMLLTPCVASHNNIHEQANYVDDEIKFSLPMILPRKLRVLLVEEASDLTFINGHGTGNDDHQDSTSNNKQKGDISSGKANKKEKVRTGTRQEWVEEGTDTSQFFTMDYSHVRRRRPIHNKSLPVGP